MRAVKMKYVHENQICKIKNKKKVCTKRKVLWGTDKLQSEGN